MKLIEMPHQTNDYTCSINGLVDMYQWKTGERLPDDLFYYISHIGFSYQDGEGNPSGRMMFWSSGLGERQYSFLEPILGYKLLSSQGSTTEEAWSLARRFIDKDTPVIMAGLDMYHLPYLEKFYHCQHVPGHYVLLVGYDESQELAHISDTSRPGIQNVPYKDLHRAWGVEHTGQSLRNSLYIIEWPDRLPDVKQIINTGIQKRAGYILNPPHDFLGIPAIRKAARDLPEWLEHSDKLICRSSLEQFVTYTASVVPLLPQKLLPYPLNYVDRHQGGRDKFALLLAEMAGRYGGLNWKRAVPLFQESGRQIELMTNLLTAFILDAGKKLDQIGRILNVIADLEEEAFRCLDFS